MILIYYIIIINYTYLSYYFCYNLLLSPDMNTEGIIFKE